MIIKGVDILYLELNDYLLFVTKTNKKIQNLNNQFESLKKEHQTLKEENESLKIQLTHIKKVVDSLTIFEECDLCERKTNEELTYKNLDVCSICYEKLYNEEL